MDDANVVGRLQRVAHLSRDAEDPHGRQRPLAMHEKPELDALDELHHEEEQAIQGSAEVGNVDNVGMLDARGRPRLAPEALRQIRRAGIGGIKPDHAPACRSRCARPRTPAPCHPRRTDA